MSIFGTIMNKIFHHPDAAPAATADASAPATASGFDDSGSPAMAAAAPNSPASTPAQPVDVGAVLSGMAAKKGGGGNYETSIVDLLKLLDMDSSLDARKELGTELGVHAGADGSAEQNTALHKAVCAKLAENGGTMPASMQG